MKIITLVLGLFTIISLFSCTHEPVKDYCSEVTGVELVSIGSNNASFKWNKAEGADSYVVSLSVEKEKITIFEGDTSVDYELHGVKDIGDITDTVISIKELHPDTKYCISIINVCDVMPSNGTDFYFQTAKE